MNCCAFPGCKTPIIDPEANTILSEVCHIRARSNRGPRYDPAQTDEERHGFDNLILMCGVHHKLIDAPENLERYSTETLLQFKSEHEGRAREIAAPVLQLTETQLAALQTQDATYESGSTHLDFRNAIFRVGGEGGHWGGGGGGGGILTIVGTTRVPAGVSLNGEDGQAPGAGGGGAGGIKFIGRPIDSDDLAGGLRVSSMILAGAASFSGGLINLLEAGWAYVTVPRAQSNLRMLLVFTIDLGDVEPATLLRLVIRAAAPSSAVAYEGAIDIEVEECADLVKRVSRAEAMNIDLNEAGIWTVELCSSGHELAKIQFECRQSA